jgi:hypothetical protein
MTDMQEVKGFFAVFTNVLKYNPSRRILMKKSVMVLSALVAVSLIATPAFAFTCPKLIKAADESIAKAEAAAANISGDREKGRAMVMIELAKEWNKEAAADHKEAGAKKDAQLHYRAEAKAKAAAALAGMLN